MIGGIGKCDLGDETRAAFVVKEIVGRGLSQVGEYCVVHVLVHTDVAERDGEPGRYGAAT